MNKGGSSGFTSYYIDSTQHLLQMYLLIKPKAINLAAGSYSLPTAEKFKKSYALT